MGAAPSGNPGWPELAAWTASIERTRRALIASVSSARPSAGGATAVKRTSSNTGAGIAEGHASGGMISYQDQGNPWATQVSHVLMGVIRANQSLWAAISSCTTLCDLPVGRHDRFRHVPNVWPERLYLSEAPPHVEKRCDADIAEQLPAPVSKVGELQRTWSLASRPNLSSSRSQYEYSP